MFERSWGKIWYFCDRSELEFDSTEHLKIRSNKTNQYAHKEV